MFFFKFSAQFTQAPLQVMIWGHHLQGPRHIGSVLLGEGRFEDKGKFIQSDFSGYCLIKAIKAHVFIFPVSPQICPQSQSLHFCTFGHLQGSCR